MKRGGGVLLPLSAHASFDTIRTRMLRSGVDV